MKSVAIVLLCAASVACSTAADPKAESSAADAGSSGSLCVSRCPNTTDTSTDRRSCEQELLNPRCGLAYETLAKCTRDKEICGSDGRRDTQATLDACRRENDEFARCSIAVPLDAGRDVF